VGFLFPASSLEELWLAVNVRLLIRCVSGFGIEGTERESPTLPGLVPADSIFWKIFCDHFWPPTQLNIAQWKVWWG